VVLKRFTQKVCFVLGVKSKKVLNYEGDELTDKDEVTDVESERLASGCRRETGSDS